MPTFRPFCSRPCVVYDQKSPIVSSASPKQGKKVSPEFSLSEEFDARVEKSRTVALAAAKAGLSKKCLDVEIIDVVGKVDYADFLVLMTGSSDRHVAAIARHIEEELGRQGEAPLAVEGMQKADWILLDFFDVVVHVFAESTRDLYDLSGLWIDASRVPVPERPPEETRPSEVPPGW